MHVVGLRAENRRLLREMAKLEARIERAEQGREHAEKQCNLAERRREQAERQLDSLRALYQAMVRRLFGQRSERIDPDQLRLEFDRLVTEGREAAATDLAEQTAPEHDEREPGRPRSRHRGRRPLPANLARRRRRYELLVEQRTCTCCAAEMVEIGEDVTEELDYEPASFYVTEHVRVKYACRACDQGITRAPMPERPIEKGRPGPGLLSHLAVAKYGDHLPLYRLESIFERAGVDIARQTMCEWIAALADRLSPVVAELKRQLLADPLLQSDDTVIPYQGDQKGRVSKGYLWAYTRPYAEVVFDFTTNHSRAGPIEFLGDFEGYLQTDGHSSYNGVYATGKVTHIGCLAHVRRKFFEARSQAPEEADMVLAAIQSLYRTERQAATAGVVGADLVALRQGEATPVLTALGNWLKAMADEYRPKSPMAKAIAYARGQWPAVVRYVDVAQARPDNNSSEQAIKPVVIGRKNWMFAGSAEGGRRAAVLYSLVVSCKRLDIDPYAYLRDVIEVVASHPNKRIGELTPRAWAAAHAAASHSTEVAVA